MALGGETFSGPFLFMRGSFVYMKISLAEIALPTAKPSPEQEATITELADSIKDYGLSHPVILKKRSAGEQFRIISGERRILAAKSLGWKEIDAEIREMDDVNGKILRLHENLRRFNIPWAEQAVLKEELHNLRQLQHGVAASNRPKADAPKGWSIRDTAAELKVGVGHLSEDMILAKALRIDPNLANIKDKATAVRLARISVNRERNEEESNSPSRRRTTSKENAVNITYAGDAAEVLKRLDPISVDHCITDPPWIKFYDPKLTIDQRTLPVFKELYRVLKPGAFLYMFSGLDDYAYYAGVNMPNPKEPGTIQRIRGQLEILGFQVALTPLIWKKVNAMSRRGVKSWEYDRDFEFVIVAAKGNPILTTPTRCSAVKTFPIVPSPSMVHPNEKPLDLIKEILKDCSYENNIIIDPFAGSGVVGAACKELKRKYILIEREAKFHSAIVKRLKE